MAKYVILKKNPYSFVSQKWLGYRLLLKYRLNCWYVLCMPVDNTSVVNVNEKISPSRAKDTKISRDIFFLSFYRGICFIDIQNNIFSSAPH